MEFLRAVIKGLGGPGSLGFFVFFAAVGLLLLVPARSRKWGRRILVLLSVTYLVLGIPAVSHSLAAGAGSPESQSVTITGEFDDVFVLEGDNNLARGTVAVKVAAATKPRKVWVIGGKHLRDALLAAGYPASAVPDNGSPGDTSAWNGSARTTREQMLLVGRLMQKAGSQRAAVVVSRLQSARTRGLAEQLDLNITVIAAPVDHEPSTSGAGRWLPSLAGLVLSRDALYEMVALAYYRRNGWI